MKLQHLPLDYMFSATGSNGGNAILSSPFVAHTDMRMSGENPTMDQSVSSNISFAASAVSGAGNIRSEGKLAAPCVCYQAKEKEALSDTLRRAGKRCDLSSTTPSALIPKDQIHFSQDCAST